MGALADDVLRGVGIAGMVLAALGAGWLFLVGSFVEGYGEDSDSWAGVLLMLSGVVGLVSACLIAQGLVVGAALRTATAAIVQGATAMLLLVWWVASDFWGGTAHADQSTLPLLAVLVLDAAVLVWAARHTGAGPS